MNVRGLSTSLKKIRSLALKLDPMRQMSIFPVEGPVDGETDNNLGGYARKNQRERVTGTARSEDVLVLFEDLKTWSLGI